MSNFINSEINNKDNEQKTKNLSFFLSVLSVAIASLTYFEVKGIIKEPITILQFPTTGEEAEVSWGTASDSYLLMAAQFIASNYYGVTPSSIDKNFSNILRLAHPSQFTELQKRLDTERNEFKKLKTISFIGGMEMAEGISITTGLKNKDYFGVGRLGKLSFSVIRIPTISGSREEVIAPERKTMNIIFTIEKGRFYLVDLNLEGYKRND